MKPAKFLAFLVFSLLTISLNVSGQKTREQLEREKQENQARIERAQRVLNQTSRKKSASIGKLRALNTQIKNQSKQIDLITEDINLIQKEIAQLEENKKVLERKLDALKKEYAEMLFIASKSSGKINKLSFLFSARSFNDLVMRYKYLEQYTDNRKKQVAQINAVAKSLEEQQLALNTKIGNQQKVIAQKQTETKKLTSLKSQQSRTVSLLASEEKKLRREIADSKKAIKRLDNLISRIVSKSVSKNRSAAPNEAVVNTKLSASFQNNKRKLPWPVRNGFISDRFGVKNHPVLKNVKIDNNGVDIQTSPNARVSSVFDGKVLDISQIPGLNNVVAIQHGEYFTVYANLKSVNVSINQDVIAGQLIGIAGQKDGEYEINFQVWHQFTKQNPESWLARK
ncbi:murein hydrolase activator EnvC family protein [Jiulongibacter sp. NS-SX5]|uniref:murein hydrolase activator EnvC family protein n=1 Tax=Jiulongibacter sp. NS-SX5 TaxID=3463854 RepID=UPI004059EC72